MARSLRSKRKQANKRKLRTDVFAPVEAARTARLAEAQKKIADAPKQSDSSKKADVLKKADEPKKADKSKEVDKPKKADGPKLIEESTPMSRDATPMEEDTLQNDNSGMLPGTSTRPPPPQDGKAGFLRIYVPETLGSDLPQTANQMSKELEFFLRLGIGIDDLVEVAGDDILAVKFTEDIVGLFADNTNKD